jgi:hypothetical protein
MTGLAIDYRKTEAEQGMLLNLHKRGWTEGLKMADFEVSKEKNVEAIKVRLHLRVRVYLIRVPRPGNAVSRFSIHKIRSGRSISHTRTAKNSSRRET